jgi:hypothetical protein
LHRLCFKHKHQSSASFSICFAISSNAVFGKRSLLSFSAFFLASLSLFSFSALASSSSRLACSSAFLASFSSASFTSLSASSLAFAIFSAPFFWASSTIFFACSSAFCISSMLGSLFRKPPNYFSAIFIKGFGIVLLFLLLPDRG